MTRKIPIQISIGERWTEHCNRSFDANIIQVQYIFNSKYGYSGWSGPEYLCEDREDSHEDVEEVEEKVHRVPAKSRALIIRKAYHQEEQTKKKKQKAYTSGYTYITRWSE